MTAPAPRRPRQPQPSRKRVEAWAVVDRRGRLIDLWDQPCATPDAGERIVHLVEAQAPAVQPDQAAEVKRLRDYLTNLKCSAEFHRRTDISWEEYELTKLINDISAILKPRPKGRT